MSELQGSTVRKAGAAELNFSRGVLIINTWGALSCEQHGPLTVQEGAWNLCSTLCWCSFKTRWMRVHACALALSLSRRLSLNAKPYLPLNAEMWTWRIWAVCLNLLGITHSGGLESISQCSSGNINMKSKKVWTQAKDAVIHVNQIYQTEKKHLNFPGDVGGDVKPTLDFCSCWNVRPF